MIMLGSMIKRKNILRFVHTIFNDIENVAIHKSAL